MIFDRHTDVPRGAYEIIVQDNPWVYYGSKTKDQAAGKHYQCIPDDVLIRDFCPVPLMADDSVLLMWVTSSTVMRAGKMFDAWGLHYRGIAFVWIKTRKDGGIIGSQGARASITKPTSELVLAASIYPRGRPLKLRDERIAQVLETFEDETHDPVVKAPRGAHSQKPDAAQERIEALFGERSRLEVFARRTREGWDAFGNQIERGA